jgi:hypothetical protein
LLWGGWAGCCVTSIRILTWKEVLSFNGYRLVARTPTPCLCREGGPDALIPLVAIHLGIEKPAGVEVLERQRLRGGEPLVYDVTAGQTVL